MFIDINNEFFKDLFLNDILSIGVYSFKSPYLKNIDIDSFEFKTEQEAQSFETYDDVKKNVIENLGKYILNNYLHDFCKEFKPIGYDEYIEDVITDWHNDAYEFSKYGDKQLTVNCFFDDCCEEVGGLFTILNKPSNNISTVYPKKHTIIIFNQGNNYVHKVQRSKNRRRVIEYRFFYE